MLWEGVGITCYGIQGVAHGEKALLLGLWGQGLTLGLIQRPHPQQLRVLWQLLSGDSPSLEGLLVLPH